MNMKQKKNKEMTLEQKCLLDEQCLARMRHSNKKVHKQITVVLDSLPLRDKNKTPIKKNVDTVWRYKQIVDDLAETSRRWSFSKHYRYDVCLPSIKKPSNVDYSPIYVQYGGPLPHDQFGEFDQESFVTTNSQGTQGTLVKWRDRLVGDNRIKVKSFGTSWNSAGELVKTDSDGHPLRDGFFGLVANYVDQLVKHDLRNQRRDRHIQAAIIAHVRDQQKVVWSSEPQFTGSHVQGVLSLAYPRSRYQIMQALGYNFEDMAVTFAWIKNNSKDPGNMQARANSFLKTLSGAIVNYNVPANYQASLRYLVHQSKAASTDPKKAMYSTKEVLYWFPDDPGQTYASLADTYDSDAVATTLHDEVVYHLKHSHYCQTHHILERYVGTRADNRAFTFAQIAKLRQLGQKQAGKRKFTRKSKDNIINTLVSWIRMRKIQFSDCQMLLHATFNDADADSLIADVDFMDKLSSILDAEKNAILADPTATRDMMTYCIFARQGGIGKTRLANAMALVMDKYRKPFQVVTKNRQVTFDPFQGYQSATSVVMDELSPSSLSWSQLKDLLDPHKIPLVASRYHNTSPWNVRVTYITDVFQNGVSDFVTDALQFSEGVSSLGYLTKDSGSWSLITKDVNAGKQYVAQLSQLLRRLPIVITMSTTKNGKGTVIRVSIINFKPSGRNVDCYDYVHTRNSVHIFRKLIDDDLSDEDLELIARQVIQMINELRRQAKKAFIAHPDLTLDKINGFVPDNCDFRVRYNDNHEPYLVSDDELSVTNLFSNKPTVAPLNNLITTLERTRVVLWNKDAHVNPNESQLDALFAGYEVPVTRSGFNEVKTIKLTDSAIKLVQSGKTADIWKELNERTARDIESSPYIVMQTNSNIANFEVD